MANNTNDLSTGGNEGLGAGEVLQKKKSKGCTRCCICVCILLVVGGGIAAAVLLLLGDSSDLTGALKGCNEMARFEDSGYEYVLAYCGFEGRYCEEILNNKQTVKQDCADDPNYKDTSYVGTYTYFDEFIQEKTLPPENFCTHDERFNILGEGLCLGTHECRGLRTCVDGVCEGEAKCTN